MARMHSRKHGKSGSKKPEKKRHGWLMYESAEIEKLIVKLAKEGKQNSEIGLILRDQYGVPDVRSLNMRISTIAEKEVKKVVPDDMYNLIKKAVELHKHMDTNHKDAKAKHGLELLESKIRRLGKYYSRKGRLQKNWKYNIDECRLLVK
jgi:small subunit ribosomal protein S15